MPETKTIHSHKNLHTNVHSNFILNSQNLKTSQRSFNKEMVKETVVLPFCGILLGNKKERTTETGNNLNDSPKTYAK